MKKRTYGYRERIVRDMALYYLVHLYNGIGVV